MITQGPVRSVNSDAAMKALDEYYEELHEWSKDEEHEEDANKVNDVSRDNEKEDDINRKDGRQGSKLQ